MIGDEFLSTISSRFEKNGGLSDTGQKPNRPRIRPKTNKQPEEKTNNAGDIDSFKETSVSPASTASDGLYATAQ